MPEVAVEAVPDGISALEIVSHVQQEPASPGLFDDGQEDSQLGVNLGWGGPPPTVSGQFEVHGRGQRGRIWRGHGEEISVAALTADDPDAATQ